MPYYDSNQNQRSGSGFFGRLAIGAIIAIVGWLMYMGQVEENPVTKEKQHVSISPAQEIRLGLESAPQMSREMGGELSNSDPRTRFVQDVGQHLVDSTVAKNSPWKFQFHLLADTQTVNAFALPGGQIFITLGLLNGLKTEAELAGVLAHEMGHVIERHSAQQMATNQFGQILTVAVGTAASNQSTAAYQIAAVVNQAMQLSYSREDESQADTWGLKLMESAGFDPYAMISVMQTLKAASKGGGGGGMDIFQSHPNPDLRMKQINAYLLKNPPPTGLSQGRQLSSVIRRSNTSDRTDSLESIFRFPSR